MAQHQDTSASIQVAVYTPESRLRRPKDLLREIWTDLQVSKELAWQLFQRKLSTRYRQTALGPLWVIIPTIFTTFVATVLRGSDIFTTTPDSLLPYPVKVLFATVVWGFFSQSVMLPLQAMRESLSILRTMRVAVEGFLLAKVGEILFDQGFQFLVLAVIFLILGTSISGIGVLGAAGLLVLMIILGMGIGFFIVPIGSLYLDIQSALPMMLRLWFFLTPVIYDKPTKYPYALIVEWNPVTPLLQGVLDLTLGQPLTDGWSVLGVAIVAMILFVFGWLVYRVSIPLLVER